jgi:hypothetical protein
MKALILYHRPTNTNIKKTLSDNYYDCYKKSLRLKSSETKLEFHKDGGYATDILENFYMRWVEISEKDYKRIVDEVSRSMCCSDDW